MLNYLELNITSEGILDLLKEVREKGRNLYFISKEDNLFKKIQFLLIILSNFHNLMIQIIKY